MINIQEVQDFETSQLKSVRIIGFHIDDPTETDRYVVGMSCCDIDGGGNILKLDKYYAFPERKYNLIDVKHNIRRIEELKCPRLIFVGKGLDLIQPHLSDGSKTSLCNVIQNDYETGLWEYNADSTWQSVLHIAEFLKINNAHTYHQQFNDLFTKMTQSGGQELGPNVGDIIIDSETGPRYFWHTALVVAFHDSNAFVASVGFDYSLNHHSGYDMFRYWGHEKIKRDATKHVFRFQPPEMIGKFRFGTVEQFRSQVFEWAHKTMHYYKENSAKSVRKGLKSTLTVVAKSCGRPELEFFDVLKEDVEHCRKHKKSIPLPLCSKYVIEVLQLALFDWLGHATCEERDGPRPLNDTEKKEFIKDFLPLSEDKCHPHNMRDTLQKEKVWREIPNAKPSKIDTNIEKENWRELKRAVDLKRPIACELAA